jgi:hypothetical protein
LLTPIANRVNRFTAKPGLLSLIIHDVEGETDLDSVNSKVTDVTNTAAPKAVDHATTNASLSFQMQAGVTYLIGLAFAQIVDPLNSTAELKEPCGQVIDTIDVTNLFPGYFVTVSA